jgi:hypothetical protein
MLGLKVAADFAWYKSILTYFADDYTIGWVKDEEVIAGLEKGTHNYSLVPLARRYLVG